MNLVCCFTVNLLLSSFSGMLINFSCCFSLNLLLSCFSGTFTIKFLNREILLFSRLGVFARKELKWAICKHHVLEILKWVSFDSSIDTVDKLSMLFVNIALKLVSSVLRTLLPHLFFIAVNLWSLEDIEAK